MFLEPLQSHCEELCTEYFIRIAMKLGIPNIPSHGHGNIANTTIEPELLPPYPPHSMTTIQDP